MYSVDQSNGKCMVEIFDNIGESYNNILFIFSKIDILDIQKNFTLF